MKTQRGTPQAIMILMVAAAIVIGTLKSTQSLSIAQSNKDSQKKGSANYCHSMTNHVEKNSAHYHSITKYFLNNNRTGTWLGNTWVPPTGWRLFNTHELQEFYRGRKILFIGDSTARRTSMTLYGVLNHTDDVPLRNDDAHISVNELNYLIDINKRKQTHNCTRPRIDVCLKFPQGGEGEIMLQSATCPESLEIIFKEMLMEAKNSTATNSSVTTPPLQLDLIVVAMGIWLHARPRDCRRKDNLKLSEQVRDIVTLQEELLDLRPGLTIVWRTSGWMADQKVQHDQPVVEEFNEAIRAGVGNVNSRHSQNLLYVDYGEAVKPRSFQERIHGDLKAHYGTEARLLLTHMLTNTLFDFGWSNTTFV